MWSVLFRVLSVFLEPVGRGVGGAGGGSGSGLTGCLCVCVPVCVCPCVCAVTRFDDPVRSESFSYR